MMHLEKLQLKTRLLLSILLVIIIGAGYFHFLKEWEDSSRVKFFGRRQFFWFYSVLILTYFMVGAYLIRKYRTSYVKWRLAFLVTYQFVCIYLMGYVIFDFHIGSLFMPWPTNFVAFTAPLKIVVIYHIFFAFILVPFLVYHYGRGAVCSWFCIYAVRAELLADCFRNQAPKSPRSIRWEAVRYIPFFLVIIVTILLLLDKNIHIGLLTLSGWYALIFMALLSSIFGLSISPLFGGRMPCRYICALGTYVRLLSRFTRFKIKTYKNKCKECGLCTKYCQMGIDVMKYVMEDKDVYTQRCVGCGICVEKCAHDALKISYDK